MTKKYGTSLGRLCNATEYAEGINEDMKRI